jgi:putative addiction module CopG family antidote
MNVSLPETLRKFVKERVDSGEYKSASAVIQEGLRLLIEVTWVREKRDVDHSIRMRELEREYIGSLPDLNFRFDDVKKESRARKRRKASITKPGKAT